MDIRCLKNYYLLLNKYKTFIFLLNNYFYNYFKNKYFPWPNGDWGLGIGDW